MSPFAKVACIAMTKTTITMTKKTNDNGRERYFLCVIQFITQFSGSGGACEHSINNDEDKFKVVATSIRRANARQSNAIFLRNKFHPATNIDFLFGFWHVCLRCFFSFCFVSFVRLSFFSSMWFLSHSIFILPQMTMYSQRKLNPKHRVVKCWTHIKHIESWHIVRRKVVNKHASERIKKKKRKRNSPKKCFTMM